MKYARTAALILLAAVCLTSGAGCKKDGGDNAEDDNAKTEYYNFEMTDYIRVPELSEITVSDTGIEAEWEAAYKSAVIDAIIYTELTDVEAKICEYDKVSIYYKLSETENDGIGEEAKKALTAASCEVVIGSGRLVSAYENSDNPALSTDSFENQLLGKKAGNIVAVYVTFPDDYTFTLTDGSESTELAGRRCTLEVTVNSIARGAVPELTDNLISNYTKGEYDTVEAYRGYIYTYNRAVSAYQSFFSLVEIISYPEKELENARLSYITGVIESNYSGTELDEEDIEALYDDLYAQGDAYARRAVLERMVMEYLFDVCDISLSESEYKSALAKDYNSAYATYYMQYGVTTAAEYESYFGKENLFIRYKYEKLISVLPDRVIIQKAE